MRIHLFVNLKIGKPSSIFRLSTISSTTFLPFRYLPSSIPHPNRYCSEDQYDDHYQDPGLICEEISLIVGGFRPDGDTIGFHDRSPCHIDGPNDDLVEPLSRMRSMLQSSKVPSTDCHGLSSTLTSTRAIGTT